MEIIYAQKLPDLNFKKYYPKKKNEIKISWCND